MLAYLKLAAIAGVLAGAAYGGYQVRDWQADADDLARERKAAEQLAAIQKGMDLASAETEKRLAAARAAAAVARTDSQRVQQLAERVTASEQASEHDRQRIRVLSELVASGAKLLAEGEEIAGRLDARHAGCAMTP